MERLLGKHPSDPFNPLIANTFFRSGYIESWGRGIEKMNRECREHGISLPHYDFGMSGLMITFHAREQDIIEPLYQTQDGLVTEPSSEKGSEKGSEKILNLIRGRPDISARNMAEELGISARGVEKHISRLKAAGVRMTTATR